jgi:hypothetical protein
MSNWFIYLKMVVFIMAILFFLIYSIGGIQSLSLLLSVLSILAIVLSLPHASLVTKVFSVSFLILGSKFVISKGISVTEYIQIFGEMLSLLSLFAIIPILALPIRIGGYGDSIKKLLSKDGKTPFQYFRDFTVFSYLFAIFLNLATLPIMYQSFTSTVSRTFKTDQKRLLSTGILQGYSLPLIWTPLSAVVGVITSFTGVKWISVFPRLFLISILPLFLNWIIFYITTLKNKELLQMHNHENSDIESLEGVSSSKKLLEVGIAIILLILIILLFDSISSMSLLIISTILSIPFAWIWSICIQKGKLFNEACKSHFIQYVPNMHNMFAIFLSAGFFVNALKYSGLDQVINQIVLSFSAVIPVSLFLITLPLITLFIACFGLHPIVAVALLAQSLNPVVLGIDPENLTIALLGGAVMTFFIGPFSGTLGIMSTLLQTTSFQIAKWNLWSTAGFYILLSIHLLVT